MLFRSSAPAAICSISTHFFVQPRCFLETSGFFQITTPRVLFLLSQQPPRKSPKLPAPRADVTAAGCTRPRGFVLPRRLWLCSLPETARRRFFFCVAALPNAPARRRNVRFSGVWRVRARLRPESRTNRRHGRDGAGRAGGHRCISRTCSDSSNSCCGSVVIAYH